MSIRGTATRGAILRGTGTLEYVGGQIVDAGHTLYAVNGDANSDIALLQQAINAAGVNMTPQQVIALGGVDGYAVGSVNINLATAAVAYTWQILQSPSKAAPAPAPAAPPSTGGTSAGPPPIGQPTSPYTPYTPPAAPPADPYTPTAPAAPPAAGGYYSPPPASSPTQTPAGGYNFIAASSQVPAGGFFSPSFDTNLGTSTAAPAPSFPTASDLSTDLMTKLATVPWYYWAGGAAAAVLLFSGRGKR